jgi:hypothetical protein
MKNLLIIFIYLLSFIFKLTIEYDPKITLDPSKSVYYQEKYFRFLANNYENIKQGDYWTSFYDEKAIGFQASKDFGSFLFVKDWSIYSFKLTKIMFRPFCSYKTQNGENEMEYDAELLLYHTIDNNYFPPGKRVYLGINFLIISVPFKKTDFMDPSSDKLLEFLNLEIYRNSLEKNHNLKIGPYKPIKLYQMIQHQPQYLFEAKDLISDEKTLYLIFSQYHHISVSDYNILKNLCDGNFGQNYFINQFEPDSKIIYRNFQNPDDLKSKLTLMAYNNQQYFKLKWIFLIIIYFILV